MVSGHLVLFAHKETVVEGILRVAVFGGDASLDYGEARECGAVVITFLLCDRESRLNLEERHRCAKTGRILVLAKKETRRFHGRTSISVWT